MGNIKLINIQDSGGPIQNGSAALLYFTLKVHQTRRLSVFLMIFHFMTETGIMNTIENLKKISLKFI